ncbi:Tango6 family protein [Pleurotus pulmonarius]
MSSKLSVLLDAGSVLVESQTPSQSNLKTVLQSRLVRYHQRRGAQTTTDASSSLEKVERATALAALDVVEGVQHIIGAEGDPDDIPAIGTRDLAQLRTLISIVIKWGIDPLLAKLKSSWPAKAFQASAPSPRIVEVSNVAEDFALLSSMTLRFMGLLFPSGPQSPLPQTLITTTILNRHVGQILSPCIALGWLPKSLNSGEVVAVDALRPLTMRLLAVLPPSQAITALGAALSSHREVPHVRRNCAYLLGRQILRPFGVRGLFAAVLGEDEGSEGEVGLEQLEHIARVLGTVPTNMKDEEFFSATLPQLLVLIQEVKYPHYRRTAAFAISRLCDTPAASKIILSAIHTPLLTPTSKISTSDSRAEKSLSTLMALVLNSDPSPTLISTLISPIFPALYSLLYHMEQVKTSDPELVESLRGLVTTWGRVIGQEEGTSTLWYLIHSDRPGWRVDIEGHIERLETADEPAGLSLLTPEDQADVEEMDETANILNLFPDPAHFVRFLKTIDRSDITSDLFVRLLEAYREAKASDDDPLRTLLYLQLVMQLQTQSTTGNTSTGILAKPSHILSFVKHALESAIAPKQPATSTSKSPNILEPKGMSLQGLRIVEEVETQEETIGGDSDDEDEDTAPTALDEEMTETAINLLLSILEVHEDLSARNEPILDDIFTLLEPLAANDSSPSIKSLARECRMVMTARLASTSAAGASRVKRGEEEEDMHATYQKALKLLQDPILPVRAHGLLLLRQLVTPTRSSSTSPPQEKPQLDPALMPSILSIFLQSIQDDDSYIFLNAVQGLSAMVETHGKDILGSLVKIYSSGLDGLAASVLTKHDVDTRIRVGEALGQVIRRCGDALGIYVDTLVPPIFYVFRSSHLPTTLRTSALSLLTECENTYSLALIPYTIDLADSMVDLLQLESVSNTQQPKPTKTDEDVPPEPKRNRDTMDDQPTSTNTKFPPLRRAALHFLSILARATTKLVYDGVLERQPFPPRLIQRAKTTLAYVASIDKDNIVRVMAREAGEYLTQLEQAEL